MILNIDLARSVFRETSLICFHQEACKQVTQQQTYRASASAGAKCNSYNWNYF